MKIKYEIEEYDPQREFMLVKLTSADDENLVYYKSLNLHEYNAEKITEMVEAVGSIAGGFWNRAQQHDTELPIDSEGVIDVEPEVYMAEEVHTQLLDQPEYDVWTERLEQQDITSPFQETVGWDIVKLTEEEAAEQYDYMETALRFERNDYLAQTDFVHLPDAGVANLDEWLEFRQALRDLPEQDGWPKSIEWPKQPDIVKE